MMCSQHIRLPWVFNRYVRLTREFLPLFYECCREASITPSEWVVPFRCRRLVSLCDRVPLARFGVPVLMTSPPGRYGHAGLPLRD